MAEKKPNDGQEKAEKEHVELAAAVAEVEEKQKVDVATLSLAEKFTRIAREIAPFEHEEQGEGVVLAALTKNHIVLLGPPGTGKSMMSTEFCKRVGTSQFYKLLSRDLPPDELLVREILYKKRENPDGSASVKFEKDWTGMLPDCELAFLDEGFKANSTTLNKLLDIILDRKFAVNGEVHKAKTMSVIIASNEVPEDECKAFYDRFLFRFIFHYLKEQGSVRNMFRMDENPRPVTTVTKFELAAAQEAVNDVEIPDAILDKMIELRHEIHNAGYIHSNRRWRQALHVVKASAFMQDKDVADEDCLDFLQHVFWHNPTPDEIRAVRALVLQAVNPLRQQIVQFYEEAEDVLRSLQVEKDEDKVQKLAVEGNKKLKNIQKKMKGVIKQISDRNRPTARYEELSDKVTLMQSEIVSEYLGVDLSSLNMNI